MTTRKGKDDRIEDFTGRSLGAVGGISIPQDLYEEWARRLHAGPDYVPKIYSGDEKEHMIKYEFSDSSQYQLKEDIFRRVMQKKGFSLERAPPDPRWSFTVDRIYDEQMEGFRDQVGGVEGIGEPDGKRTFIVHVRMPLGKRLDDFMKKIKPPE